MRSQHSRVTLIASCDSDEAMPDPELVRRASISSTVFSSLIKLALTKDKKSPLSRRMTRLLGLSIDDEVILTKQIGTLEGENLHGLLVSINPNADDVILVAKSNTMMEIYLTDSCCQLRAAATLKRDSDQPELLTGKYAMIAFARELETWNVLAKKMSHLYFLKSYMQRTCIFEI